MGASLTASFIFNQLFLSPLVFILPFFILSLFARRVRWLFIFFALFFYFLSTGVGVKLLLGPLENEYRKSVKIDFKPDAVVVLGGGANAFVPDSKLGASSYKRFSEALMLAKKMDLPLVFSGGGHAAYDGITEADAASQSADKFADSFGFAKPSTTTLYGGFGVMYENKSENTLQNAANSILIMRQGGVANPRIVLVTSAFHMKRAKIIFEKQGFRVTPYAVDFIGTGVGISYLDALCDFKNLHSNFIAIKEYLGIFKFFLVDKPRSEK